MFKHRPIFFWRHAVAMCVLVLAAAAAAGAPPAAPAARPNFVVLLCDDLGYGDLGCFGSPTIRTPNLDRLAAGGARLTQCYSASPVCSPSRAGLFTGRNPNRLGIRDWIPANSGVFLKKEEVTIAALLRRAGYRTGLAGKWHLNSRMDGTEPTPGDHGFDHWLATQNNAAPTHQDPTNFFRNGQPVGPLQGNSSTIIADEGLRFLRETPKGAPFALFLTFHAPHEPVATPEEFTRLYATEPDATKRTYYGSVSLVDHEVGRVVGELDRLRLRENTLVVFTSDNGPETLRRYRTAVNSHGSPGPLRGMKLHVHEAGYRVPGIASWPGRIPAGQVNEEPVSALDLLPTFCALAGIAPPADRPLDGASLLPLFSGQPVRRSTPLYWQYDRAISRPWQVALREGPWKLLADAALERFELFHLEEDPAESRDRAAAEPERVRRMAEAMRRLHREINAATGAGR